jgi:hypothetical protein
MDADFMASALRIWDERSDLDVLSLARRFDCGPESVILLALCRRPRQATFQADCKQMASETGIAAALVAQVVRHADAFEALRGCDDQQLLAAARDHIGPPDSNNTPE